MSLPDTGTVGLMVGVASCVPHAVKALMYLRANSIKAKAEAKAQEEGRQRERRVERRQEFINLSNTVRSLGKAIERVEALMRDEIRAVEDLIHEKNDLDNARYLELYKEITDKLAALGNRISAATGKTNGGS